jgi:hypothetical protein
MIHDSAATNAYTFDDLYPPVFNLKKKARTTVPQIPIIGGGVWE